ncbi:MAG: BatD family protein [Pseudomonadales bacterium]
MVSEKMYLIAKSILLSILCLSANVLALTVTVERQIIPINETLRLTIVDNAGEDPSDIDISDIEANFSVVNESSQSSFSMINGRTESVRTRVLILVPLKLGTALIPPLTLDKQTSKAIKIKVIKALPAANELKDQSVILESSVDKSEVVVGGQLIYIFRVIYRVQLNNAEITPPSIEGADLTPLEDKNYTRTINGQNYNVTEKRYAVFFSKAGLTTIPSQSLTALLSSNQRRNLGFDPYARGRELRLESKALTVNVLSQPQAPTAITHWLPAAKIELQENAQATQNSRVGEPITRSISIMAQGLPAELLPALMPQTPDSINNYPEKPELVNQEFIGGIAGKRSDTIAMVPTQAGTFTLPAISIPWWNTDSQRWETASLPARTITVLAAKKSSLSADNNPIESNIGNSNQANAQEQTASDSLLGNTSKNTIWMPIALVALGGWLITLLYLWLKPSQPKTAEETSPLTMSSDQTILKTLSKQLLMACKKNDAAAAKQQLQSWLVCYKKDYPIEGDLSITLNNAIATLDNHLFNQHGSEQNWDGLALQKVIQALITASSNNKNGLKQSPLAPLYPGQ